MGSQAAENPDTPSPQQTPAAPDDAATQEIPVVKSAPVPPQTLSPEPTKPKEVAADALAAEKARVQSLIARMVSNAHASTATAQPSKQAPAQQTSSGKQAPFEWTETPTDASLVYRIPTVDSCWWALEDRSDGTRVLLVELEKTVPSMWGGVIEGEDHGSVERPNATDGATPDDKPDAHNNGAAQATEAGERNTSPEHFSNGPQTVGGEVQTFVENVIDNVSASLESGEQTEVEDVPEEDDSPDTAPGSEAGESADATPASNSTAASPSSSLSSSDAQGRKVLTRADLPKLIEQHRAAVAGRDPGWGEAAVKLGTLYHYAIGVERDDAEAARL